MAMDDALIAVFDAKYNYNFWRPVTAIRNGDLDGNDATERDAVVDAVHRHADASRVSVRALHRVGAVGTVLQAEIGTGPTPTLSTTSSDAPEAPRAAGPASTTSCRRSRTARIYDGVHYRNSTEVGTAMGRKVGELVAKSLPKATR